MPHVQFTLINKLGIGKPTLLRKLTKLYFKCMAAQQPQLFHKPSTHLSEKVCNFCPVFNGINMGDNCLSPDKNLKSNYVMALLKKISMQRSGK